MHKRNGTISVGLALISLALAAAPSRAEDASQPPAPAVAGMSAVPAASPADDAPAPAAPEIPAKFLVPAKQLFGSVKTAAPLEARAIGGYSRGCLAGGQALPVDGPQWQAMRLSRNRNWGHPALIRMLQRFSDEAWRYEGWPGLLVGDLSQPRGGPMLTGHASHQIGLDADIWFTPMPDRRLTTKERETLEATSMLAADNFSINAEVWNATRVKLVQRVAGYGEVERILVHPSIKKAMCDNPGPERGWLAKVRPYFGHYYHFHVRLACPAGATNCTAQKPVPGDDGCGKELADWLKRVTPKPPAPPTPGAPAVVAKAERPMTLDQLPSECRVVLNTGNPGVPKELLAQQRKADLMVAQAAAKAAIAKAQSAKQAAKQASPAPAAAASALPVAPSAAPTATPAVAPGTAAVPPAPIAASEK